MDQTSPQWNSALEYVWGEYRVWAATARQQRAEIAAWRVRVLALTIAGAALGTLARQLPADWAGGQFASLSGLLGILSAIALALATFFTREILSLDRERRWVRARSMAEALKTESYLFRAGVPPYDGPDEPRRLLGRVSELLGRVKDLDHIELSQDQKRERLPVGPLSAEDYIHERVDDQIENYYQAKARDYQNVLSRGRTASLALGALATVLAALGALQWTAGWVAVLTTITAAVAAFLYAGRYQYLVVSYQATAAQLDNLKHEWQVGAAPAEDSVLRNQFIRNCEDAISIENNAWMARLLESREEKQPIVPADAQQLDRRIPDQK